MGWEEREGKRGIGARARLFGKWWKSERGKESKKGEGIESAKGCSLILVLDAAVRQGKV